MKTIKVSIDGDQVCVLIGPNLQEGIAGFGENLPNALRALASELERDWTKTLFWED